MAARRRLTTALARFVRAGRGPTVVAPALFLIGSRLVSPSPPMAEAVADGINSELNDRVTHIVTAHNTVHDKDVEND